MGLLVSGLRRRALELERKAYVRELEAKILTRTSALRDALNRLEQTEASARHAERNTVDRLVTALTLGSSLLAEGESPVLRLAAEIALTHHERWDGGGYPHGLAGETIPVFGRIAAIADAFDAMTSDRVYRVAMPISEALSEIEAERGRHFDPKLVDVFVPSFEELGTIRNDRPDAPPAPRPD